MNITAYFTNSGTPATGLSPIINIRDLSDNSLVVTGEAMSEVGDGFYKYTFAGYNTAKDYTIRCDGGVALPAADRYSIATTGQEGEVVLVKTQTDKMAFTVANQIDANTLTQANIDFGALQKASLNAATPAASNMRGTDDAATAVWAAVARTLTAFGFTPSLHSDYNAAKTAAPAGTALSSAVWTNTKAGYLDAAVSGATAPTAAAVAGAVWDEVLDIVHEDAGSASVLLQGAGAAGDPWITALPGAYAAGTAGYRVGTMTSLGAGAITWTYTLTNSVTGDPIDGAEVWVTTDSLGANIIASGVTDAYGVVTFMLDAGIVFVWRKCAGFNFVNPDQETVA